MNRTVLVIGSVLVLLSCAVYAQEPQEQESQKPCTEKMKKIEDCPEGCGSWDPQFDKKRNIIEAPKSQKPKPMTLDEIRALKYPMNWSLGQNREELRKLGEGTYVQVTAYLIGVKYGDLSSANCKLAERWSVNDILILVSEKGLVKENLSKKEARKKFGQFSQKEAKKIFNQREASSVTAEITPRVRLAHTKLENNKNIYNWFKEKLQAYIDDSPNKARFVRIKGLLLLDTEHIYKPLQRSTDWQISPVLEIEVCQKKDDMCVADAEWTKLDNFSIGTRKQPPPRPKDPFE